MKTKSLNFRTLFVLAVSFSALFFNSCSKTENDQKLEDTNATEEFSKDIQLSDKFGENSIVMRVSTSDKSILELYSSKNFEVIPVQEGQKATDAIKEYYGQQDESENMDEEFDGVENDRPSISFQIISKKLKSGIKNVAITYIHPVFGDDRASWDYYTHYSQAGQNLEQTAFVERHNLLRRVYFGMFYKAYSSSSWSTIVSEWRSLSNNESYSSTKNPCYQFKVTVKTKKSKTYTVSFEY